MAEAAPESVAALAALVDPGDAVGLIGLLRSELDRNWDTVYASELTQMLRSNRSPLAEGDAEVDVLAPSDVDEIMALVELTHPGPFRRRTIELGRYIGIRERGRLVAMAGERMHVGEFHEVSAVCTHPDAQGRGHARALIGRVVNRMLRADETPFLHVESSNARAIALYETLGFAPRAKFSLQVAARLG